MRVTRDQLVADAVILECKPGDVLVLQTDDPETALGWADELVNATEKLPVPTMIVGPDAKVFIARQADLVDGAVVHVVHDR